MYGGLDGRRPFVPAVRRARRRGANVSITGRRFRTGRGRSAARVYDRKRIRRRRYGVLEGGRSPISMRDVYVHGDMCNTLNPIGPRPRGPLSKNRPFTYAHCINRISKRRSKVCMRLNFKIYSGGRERTCL